MRLFLSVADGLSRIRAMDGVTQAVDVPPIDRPGLLALEDPKNRGVAAVLAKAHVAVALHDGTFRKPLSDIILHQIGSPLFPPTDFPEIPGGLVASPGKRLHAELVRRYRLSAGPRDATLLVGWSN